MSERTQVPRMCKRHCYCFEYIYYMRIMVMKNRERRWELLLWQRVNADNRDGNRIKIKRAAQCTHTA